MKNQKGISLIALIITIIVIIILAAIVIVRAMGTVDSANKAKFDSEFSDFRDEVVKKGLDIYSKIITSGYTTDSADYFYMAARDAELKSAPATLPTGKTENDYMISAEGQLKHLTAATTALAKISDDGTGATDNIVEIDDFAAVSYNNKTYPKPGSALKAGGAADANGDTKIYCYKIDSSKLDGFRDANKPNFHGIIGAISGDNNVGPDTKESHWITENGVVFTYPGYAYDGNLYLTNNIYTTGV